MRSPTRADIERRFWPALALVVGALALWPQRTALRAGDAIGAGPDVVSTLWGMWWFSQEWLGAAWSGWTGWVNHPYGAFGTVLSPSSAITWSLTAPLVGAGAASVVTAVVQLTAFALGIAWLARLVGGSRIAATGAALSALVGRYLLFGLGEGSVVAIAAVPIPLGLGLLLTIDKERRWIGAGLCMAGAAIENPYLAPVLPAVGALSLLRALRQRAPLRGRLAAGGVGAGPGGRRGRFTPMGQAPGIQGRAKTTYP